MVLSDEGYGSSAVATYFNGGGNGCTGGAGARVWWYAVLSERMGWGAEGGSGRRREGTTSAGRRPAPPHG
eukprot:84819-Rhodomonas_salina.1